MNTNLIKVLKQCVLITSVAVGVIAAGTKPAAAACNGTACLVNCTPTSISFNDAPYYQVLSVTCDGVAYQAQAASSGPGGGCSPANARSPDAQRYFMTLAESAILSGKKLNITYNTCYGYNWMYIVELVK